jgi:PAS domain S-box-containing protein
MADCTDDRAAVTAGRARHDRDEDFRLIVESAVDYAIVAMDGQRIVTRWNRGAQRLLGFSEDDIVGRSADTFFTEEDRARGEPVREATLALTAGRAANERWHVRKDGSRFWGSGLMSPLRDESGAVTGLVKIFRDMTAAKAAAEEREHLLALAERARADAERANRAKDEFLAVLSHELRSPLNAMLGWVQVLTRATLPDDPVVRRAIATLERNIWTQSQVVSDLLDVSRITSGKMQLDLQRIDLPGLVVGVAESHRPAAEAKGLALVVQVPAEQIAVSGDLARLQQIVGNLVGNAIKFTDQGSVTVRVAPVDGEAEVTVRDTGSGIPAATLPTIFDRFVQSERSSTRRHGGLGLGLAIVKELTTLHGGSVRADSEGTGRGSCFTVRLPVLPPVRRPVPTEPSSPLAIDLTALDLLIVEDDRDTREALETLLAETGARVRAAGGVSEALAAWDDRRPDAIVSDIGMPGEDGYALIRAVRERERASASGPRVLAIAMTGFASRDDHEAAIRAGFDDHVGKPVAPSVLIAKLHDLAMASRRD